MKNKKILIISLILLLIVAVIIAVLAITFSNKDNNDTSKEDKNEVSNSSNITTNNLANNSVSENTYNNNVIGNVEDNNTIANNNLTGDLGNNTTGENSSNSSSINFYTLKTHLEFDSAITNNQFKITNQDELATFQKYFEKFELREDCDFSNNTLFVQTQELSSGSDSINFTNVDLSNNKVTFVADTIYAEFGTDDMAYWYLIAIVPNDELTNIDTSNWQSPSNLGNN